MLKNQKLVLSLGDKVVLDTELSFKKRKDGYGDNEFIVTDTDGMRGFGETTSKAIADYLTQVAGYGF